LHFVDDHSVSDTISGTTAFASAPGTYTGQVVSVTNPQHNSTTLSFAAGGQIASVAQANPPADGGAGTSTTRLTYPTTTQTLVADPTTNQSMAVSAVPHTTYTLDSSGSGLALSAQDPDGNTRAATYTSLNSLATSTPASGGATTFTYGANTGESLTKAATAAGASDSAAYGNTGASQYEPSSATNDASNSLQFTYYGQGNQLTSTQGMAGPQAVVTYNTNGTPATSASPGAAMGVVTSFGYDTNFDQNAYTPPTGTSLGSRAYTWDGFGRLATATDGRGNTTTYTYDNADRITKIHSSATGTTDASYTYNSLNRVTQRIDASGTTTYTYDDLSQLLTVANTYGGGTSTYTYDLGGNLATTTTAVGTRTYGYDVAHELTSIAYTQGATAELTVFKNDPNGRRTDVWLQSNTTHTSWSAHEGFTYDSSARVKTALSQNGPATAPVTIFNQTLCYSAGAVAPACPTTAASDRSKVQWITDSVTGQTTTYGYDTSNRLHTATLTGGANPRTYTYGYDAASNRTSSVVTGTSPSSQTLTFNAANQITTTGYTYDGAGNLTAWPGHTATYNGNEQQTTTVDGAVTSTYLYAGTTQNELVSQTDSAGGSYKYVYGRPDSNGNPEIESTTVGTSTGYLFNDPTGLPVMLQTVSVVTCMYMYDGLGNPAAMANPYYGNAYTLSFDPYGTATRTDGGTNNGGWAENPYLFQGGLQNRATGTLKYGPRSYNSATGGWTQQDTRNAPLDPANANRYAYAGGDPINNNDPTGREITACGAIIAGSGIVLGLVGLAAVVSTGGLGAVGVVAAVFSSNLGVAGGIAYFAGAC
jgi:RHS repeat-associated protein